MRSELTAGGLAVLAALAFALPANAAGEGIALYSGANLSGEKVLVDLAHGECVNLEAPALSGVNIAAADLEVFFNADCVKGLPGRPSDIHYVLGSLHQADFPFPAVSYRLR
ncbi:hypothetical protein SAMN05216553_10464 [Lentzea fradiae]|uniref:Uncharacterized protein n=1 Tax=Lentzea fradiae TaxID=200378 RepID=A0A1G7PTB7_9PSEU|nr:hypothetical protein [Lentzea fradiae]SDF89567.1 hypothetical protein SAMN05216553_10464 [Lentzea fradiae]